MQVEEIRDTALVALDEIKAGKAVSTASTTPYGCSIHYK